jgi:hypothetical protein
MASQASRWREESKIEKNRRWLFVVCRWQIQDRPILLKYFFGSLGRPNHCEKPTTHGQRPTAIHNL